MQRGGAIHRFQQQGVSQENLKQARDVIESLQLAELDNFFRDACLDAKPVKIEELDPTAAVFYTIILPDRSRSNRRYTRTTSAPLSPLTYLRRKIEKQSGASPHQE